jgi:hypothetical protein
VECKNTTANGNKCAPVDVIEKFVRLAKITFISAKIKVDLTIQQNNATFFTDDGLYFPLRTTSK